MDFQTTQEHDLIKKGVTEISNDYSEEYWREARKEREFPAEFYEDLAAGGWLGIPFPTEYGGQGLGLLEFVLVMEALVEDGSWESTVNLLLGVIFGGIPVLAHGTEEQKHEYLPKIIEGEETWSLGVTEPDAGLNTAKVTTMAERDGDEFVINGQKQWISGLDHADRMLLLARTEPRSETESSLDGLTMFIVNPPDSAIEANEIPLDIYFPDRTFEVHIDELRVSEERILGAEGRGFHQVLETLNTERITAGVCAWGAGRWALDEAVAYAKERSVWSEPIGAHQAIQHPLADAHADLESARLMNRKAAWQYDNDVGDIGESSNVANLQSGKAGWQAAEVAMKTFGGMSASAELGIADAWGFVRHLRSIPVSEEMIWNFIGQNTLGLPKSY